MTILAVLSSSLIGAAQSTAEKLPTTSNKNSSVVTSPVSSEAAQFVLCQNHKNVRTIRVQKNDKGAQCLTYYDRGGVDKEVGHAHNFMSCTKIMNNIRTNLEKASWNCRDVGSVTMTSTSQ